MAGRKLPTTAPHNIAQTTIHLVVVQIAATLRMALGNTCDRAAAHGADSKLLAMVQGSHPWVPPDVAR